MKNSSKNFWKRGISLALALMMCLSLLPVTAFAAGHTSSGRCAECIAGNHDRVYEDNGSPFGHTYCKCCGATLYAFGGWETYCSQKGHNPNIKYTVTKQATCTSNAIESGRCPDCKETVTVTVENSALGHDVTVSKEDTDKHCVGTYFDVTGKCTRPGCNARNVTVKVLGTGEHQVEVPAEETDKHCVGATFEYTGICKLCKKNVTVTATGTRPHNFPAHDCQTKVECSYDNCNEKSDYGDHNLVIKAGTDTATCKATGTATYECSVCHDPKVEETRNTPVNPSNHTGGTQVKNAKTATCTEDGYTGDTYCLGCGEKIADGTTVEMLAHTYGTEWVNNETHHWHECSCGAKADKAEHDFAWTNGEWKCKDCGATGNQAHEIDKDNWTCVIDESTVCRKAHGLYEGVRKYCGTPMTWQPVGTGEHKFVGGDCQTESTCEFCGTEGELGDHTRGTFHNEVAGTCLHEGTVAYYDCANGCGAKLDAEGNALVDVSTEKDPNNHDADCVLSAWKSNGSIHWQTRTCSTSMLNIASHNWTDVRYDTASGTFSYKCGTCGREVTGAANPPSTHVHNGEWTDNAANYCKHQTVTETKTCSCGFVETKSVSGTKDQTIYSPAKNATCTEYGNIEHWSCAGCSSVFTDADCTEKVRGNDVVIRPLGHDYVAVVTDPTCTEGGYTTHTCSRCGDTFVDSETAATGHTLGDHYDAITATCFKGGNVEYWDCKNCDATVGADGKVIEDVFTEIDPNNHAWGNWTITTTPTATTKGLATRVCNNDSNHTETEELPALNDLPATGWTKDDSQHVDPKCEIAGKDVYVNAELGLELTVVIPELGHDWGDWTVTTDPTADAVGEATRTCKRCGGTDTKTLPALGGNGGEGTETGWTYEVTVEPGCTTDGLGTYTYTEDGSTVTVTIPATGHAWGDWTVALEPTYAAEGLEIRTCANCGETQTRVISALELPEGGLGGDTEEPEIEIEDEQTPLAGMPYALNPEDLLTRGHLMYVLHWFDGEPEAEISTFIDVAFEAYYSTAIGWAQDENIARGTPDNKFMPEDTVTRGQMEVFLTRYAEYLGLDMEVVLVGDDSDLMFWAEAETILNEFFASLPVEA